jgi:hypothetical protein
LLLGKSNASAPWGDMGRRPLGHHANPVGGWGTGGRARTSNPNALHRFRRAKNKSRTHGAENRTQDAKMENWPRPLERLSRPRKFECGCRPAGHLGKAARVGK